MYTFLNLVGEASSFTPTGSGVLGSAVGMMEENHTRLISMFPRMSREKEHLRKKTSSEENIFGRKHFQKFIRLRTKIRKAQIKMKNKKGKRA